MPFFLTTNEMLAAFVETAEYINPLPLAAGGPLASVDGTQVILADTSGGGFTLTLESPLTAEGRWNPIIINVGANTLTLDPGAANINGVAGTQLIVNQNSAIDLTHNGVDFYAPDEVEPFFTLPVISDIASLQFEYDIQSAVDTAVIWDDVGRATVSTDGSIVDNFDATFVALGAAATPRADPHGAPNAPLRLTGGGLPPSAIGYLEITKGGAFQGGFIPDWDLIVPFDVLFQGINKAFTIAWVANFSRSTGLVGGVFSYLTAAGGLIRIVHDSSDRIAFTKIDEDANVSFHLSSPVSNVWSEYVLVYTGTEVTLYEDGIAIIATVAAEVAGDIGAALLNEIGSTQGSSELDFDLGAVSYFNTAITDPERTILDNYYNDRFGL